MPAPSRRSSRGRGAQAGPSSTTRLPAALLDELGFPATAYDQRNAAPSNTTTTEIPRHERAAFFASRGRGRGRGGSVGGALGRKEARKAQRDQKRFARANHHDQKQQQRKLETQVTTSKPSAPPPRQMAQSKAPLSSGSSSMRDFERRPGGSIDIAEPKHSTGQRKHVGEDVRTPLQKLLQKVGGEQGVEAHAGFSTKKRSSNDTEDGLGSGKRTKQASAASAAAALSSTEKNEEKEIAWLEAHLGMRGKVKAKGKAKEDDFNGEDDGLEDLLGDLDRFYPGMYDEDGTDAEDASDGDGFSTDEDDGSELDSDLDEADEDGDSMEDYDEDEEQDDDVHDEDEDFGIEDNDVDIQIPQGSNRIGAPNKVSPDKELPSSLLPSGRYVPPALRRKMAESNADGADVSEQEQKLNKTVKGLLNRLGENNVEQIVSEIESLYRQYSRAQATACVTTIVLDTISAGDNVSETFVILYATVVASLHRIVGVEFGAHLLQELVVQRFVKQYDVARREQDDDSTVSKAAQNLSALIASLYNLNVVACPLMYDVVRLLLGMLADGKAARRPMNELDTDILLKIVKLCGTQLRYDDPTSLKAIVHLAQEQHETAPPHAATMSTRTKFLLESLSDLRNNRSRATTASVGVEVLNKMRKFLGALPKKHTIRTYEPLRVGLADLQNVDKRGKWWLVGAAWAGHDSAELQKERGEAARVGVKEEDEAAQLMQLARQHGMNTAIRQQIFTTLLSSQDYLDAVQRLLALTHKKPTQRREIVRVLMHCLGREPTFNPFYVVVGQRLAREDGAGTRITLQYCLWDYMRRLGEKQVGGQSILSRTDDGDDVVEEHDEDGQAAATFGGQADTVSGVANVARAYGWWMAKGAVNLDVLRAVDFTSLRRRGTSFLQQLFVHLLLSLYAASPVQTLTRHNAGSDGGSKKERQAIETVFVQGTRTHQRVAQGIMVFLETQLSPKHCRSLANELGVASQTTDALLQARTVALETVRVGSRLAANNDVLDDDN